MIAVPRPGGQQVSHRRLVAACHTALVLLAGLGFLGALPQSTAAGGRPASTDNAQVRILENGEFRGGGTVVDPHWVLTARHIFQPTDPRLYSMAFGVVNDRGDPDDQSNLRAIDRIVLHPRLADVALVHLAQPVPSTITIPQLAQNAPGYFTPAVLYGWAPSGHVLYRESTLVIDPVASENAAALRVRYPGFADAFPAGIDPMVTDADAGPGDSGSGVFDPANTLLGVVTGGAGYQYVNHSGNLAGPRWVSTYQEPVWHFREWINRVISGEGPSDPHPPHDELKRRRLADIPSGARLPMTQPPQIASSADAWPLATLTPETGTKGLVTVTCPTVRAAKKNTCTQEIDGQLEETIGNDDPIKIRVGSGRQVIAWCRTTGTLTKGAEPVPAIRVSFTNTDTAVTTPPPTGYGWYAVDPTQLRVRNAPLDPATLTAC